jgi:sugar lactone lactonase YvrE
MIKRFAMTRALTITVLTIITVCVLANDAQAHPPWGIVVDRQGQIYFSDLETIWKIDTQGKLNIFRAGVSGRHTHELTIDEAGNIYGEDLNYEPATQRYIAALWKMTPAGGFTYTLAPTDNPPKGMSIWRDRDGNTYSASWKSNSEHETIILKRTPGGKVTTLFGSPEVADKFRQVVLYSVGGMAFANDGSLYVADGASIRKVTTAGVATTLVRNLTPENASANSAGKNSVTRLLGIAADAQGNLFAAAHENGRVLKITPDGKVTTLVHGEQLWLPTGVTFRNGNLYILEFEAVYSGTPTPRVRKLSPDGKVTVLASVGENENTALLENSASENPKPSSASTQNAPYALIVAGAGVFALIFIIWGVRRKIFTHQQQ